MRQETHTSKQLLLSEALDIAEQTRVNGHYSEAEALYNLILQASPTHATAMHGLSIVLCRQGHTDTALETIKKLLFLHPENPDYWNTLGEVKQQQRKYGEASTAFQKALELQPNHLAALDNLGNMLSCRGDENQAAKYYCRAIIANRKNIKSSILLGMSYASLGRIEEATDVYYQWLQKEPGNPIAAHFYAACSGNNIPERASNSYIEKTFDGFSSDFDEHMTRNLSYKVPQLIEDLLANTFIPKGNLHTLDAGCGTGLCGKILAPYSISLTGVDLSSGMLAAAQNLGIYDELIKEEITEFLSSKFEKFDMIVMADTLIYFGSLKTVFAAVSNALRINGLFVFSVESGHESPLKNGSRLNYNGRYSHKKKYVLDSLKNNGLSLLSIAPRTLRTELGSPVDGMLIMAIKSPNSIYPEFC